MSVIIANIKLYNPFNNRFLLVNYAILVIMNLFLLCSLGKPELTQAFENNQYPLYKMFFFFLSVYLFGTIVGCIQLDVLTKPYSSCLPNQKKAAARTATWGIYS